MYPVSSLGRDPGWWRARGSLIPDLIRDHNTAAAAVAPCHCPHCSQLTRAQCPQLISLRGPAAAASTWHFLNISPQLIYCAVLIMLVSERSY